MKSTNEETPVYKFCEVCEGSGKSNHEPCQACGGMRTEKNRHIPYGQIPSTLTDEDVERVFNRYDVDVKLNEQAMQQKQMIADNINKGKV